MTIGQVPQSFLFGSVGGSWVAFALFGGIAVFVGVAIASILGRLAARDGTLPYYGTTATARGVIGSVVGAALLVSVWWWLWSGFYGLEASAGSVTLHFHAPPRDRVLAKQEIAGTRWGAGPKASRVLVIETRSGARYHSMQTLANDAFERRVTQALLGNVDRARAQ